MKKTYTFRMRINSYTLKSRGYRWTYKSALIQWIGAFIAFGPFQYYLLNFAHYSFAYCMFQGLFIATFMIGVLSLIYWLRKLKAPTDSELQ